MRKLWFCVENKGSFDVNLATVVGFTTKRNDDSKVGKYGSGLKYSIPFLLRNKIDFKLFVNGQEVIFGTETIDGYHNGQICQTQVVTVNGKSTSLSIDSGPEWEKWFVVRELLQNGLDEEEFAFDNTSDIAPRQGYTQWYIDAFSFAPILQSFDSYFSFKRTPIQTIEMSFLQHPVYSYNHAITVKVYEKNGLSDAPGTIYYRGFRVGSFVHSIFDYDISYCPINEYRLMSNEYDVKRLISSAVLGFGNTEVLTLFFSLFDSSKDIIWYSPPSNLGAMKDFIKASSAKFVSPYSRLAEIMKDSSSMFDEHVVVLPHDIIRQLSIEGVLENKIVNDAFYQPATLSAEGCARLNAALEWFDQQGLVIVNCSVVTFENNNGPIILGTVDMKTGEIFLSVDLFDNPSFSDDLLLQTIYEEYAHWQYKASDETRKFQDALIGDIIRLRKLLHPYYGCQKT